MHVILYILEYNISNVLSWHFKNIPEVAKFRVRTPPEDAADDTLVEWDGASKDGITAGYQVIKKWNIYYYLVTQNKLKS